LRNALAPYASASTNLVVKERVQTVDGNDARDFQFLAQKHCRMAARQSSMGMDQINPSGPVQLADV
jgi:hypothetical protein